MEQENPLVSIVVVTYNSSKYVLETLESTKSQTYRNIELIVSDDCSSDNTVEMCRNWIEENKDRFVRIHLITVEKNTGISANCNRGVKKTTGEWVKIIAGDDALENCYCEQVINYSKINPNALCMVTNATKYNDNFTDTNITARTNLKKHKMFSDDITPEKQFQILLRYNAICAPTAIINKKVYDELGYYNEKYPFFEDRPFWLKITKAGIRICLLEIYGAKYRINSGSVQKVKQKEFWSKYKISYYYAHMDWSENYPHIERFLRIYALKVEYFCYTLFNNKKHVFITFIIKILNRLSNFILNRISKKYY